MRTLSEHIAQGNSSGINLKSSVMEFAALARGLEVERLSNILILIRHPEHGVLPFINMNGPDSSHVGKELCGRKDVTLRLLGAALLPIPESRRFARRSQETAWRFANSLHGEVVVKPTRLSGGRGVTTGITTETEFDLAWDRAFNAYGSDSSNRRILVQQQVLGEDYRFFVVDDVVVSATHRRRASVEGNGKSTLGELIAQKNVVRLEHPTLNTYPIPTARSDLDELVRRGISLDYIPDPGERVTLRRASNLSGGGDSVDVTDEIHEDYRQIAKRALRAVPGMAYAGVDIIAPEITAPAEKNGVVVTEVEYSPGPMTDFPIEGNPRDMGGAILGHYLGA